MTATLVWLRGDDLMNVLFYALHYGPDPGGAGPFNSQLGAWLAARGHNVTVISTPPHYPQWRVADEYRDKGHVCERVDGVTVHRVPLFVPPADQLGVKNRIRHETSFSLNATRCWLPEVLRRKRFDLVLSVCPPLQAAIPPLVYSRLKHVPFVFFLHDLQVDQAIDLGMIQNVRAVRALHRIENSVLRAATRIATHTESMRRNVIAKGVDPARTFLLPTWADVETIKPSRHRNEFRAELGVADGATLISYAGGMGEKHGLELVLEAADRLRDRSDIRIEMIGAGPRRASLENEARQLDLDNVQFWPLQPLERMPQVLAAADAHLVISRGEAADLMMPAKLTNILASGRASIATAAPGTAVSDVLSQNDAGLVVPPGDAGALAGAIARIADDKGLSTRLAHNARTYAMRNLSSEAVLGRFESELVSLVESTSGRRR